MLLPFTKESIEKIKNNIAAHAKMFGVEKIPVHYIGSIPAGRPLIEAKHWPIKETLKYFESHKYGRVEGSDFVILDHDYFQTGLEALPLPITFSIDERIERELVTMTELYAELYDIENRMRFLLQSNLATLHVPKKVKERIAQEKERGVNYVLDTRTTDFEFCDFGDIGKIIENNQSIFPQLVKVDVVSKLEYLNEVRNFVAHTNVLTADHVRKSKEYMAEIRSVLKNT